MVSSSSPPFHRLEKFGEMAERLPRLDGLPDRVADVFARGIRIYIGLIFGDECRVGILARPLRYPEDRGTAHLERS